MLEIWNTPQISCVFELTERKIIRKKYFNEMQGVAFNNLSIIKFNIVCISETYNNLSINDMNIKLN